MKAHFETFFAAYIRCALWSSTDGDEPLDNNYDADDIRADSLEILRAHALSFFAREYPFIDQDPDVKLSGDGTDIYSHAGHDFWLTQNGHGAGFWDGDWPKYGDKFTATAKCYPEIDLYAVDGELHV